MELGKVFCKHIFPPSNPSPHEAYVGRRESRSVSLAAATVLGAREQTPNQSCPRDNTNSQCQSSAPNEKQTSKGLPALVWKSQSTESKGWRYTENQDKDSCLKQVRMEGPCVTLETADYCPCSQSPVERKRDGNTVFGRFLSSTRPAACLSPRKTCPGCIPSTRAFLISSLPFCLNIHSLSPQQVYYIRYVSPHFCPIQSLSEQV